MISNGFITLHRKITEWEWYGDINTVRVFIHLLLTVNWEDKRWQGQVIKRGSRVITWQGFSEEIGLSVQNVRTAFAHLESTGEVTRTATNKYQLVTVENYGKYQDYEQSTNNQLTINQQSTNNQLTINQQQLNNINNINNINKATSYTIADALTDEEFELLDSKTTDVRALLDWIDDNRDIRGIKKPYAYCLKVAGERGLLNE